MSLDDIRRRMFESEDAYLRRGAKGIDTSIRPLIIRLNEAGYTTVESCSGLRREHPKLELIFCYIMFDISNMTPRQIMNIWYAADRNEFLFEFQDGFPPRIFVSLEKTELLHISDEKIMMKLEGFTGDLLERSQ